MSGDVKIRNAAVWGLCFIASAIFFLTEPTISNFSSNIIVRFLLSELAIFLYIFSFIAHIRGFVFLGRKLGSSFLEWSSQAMVVTLTLFGLSVLVSVFFQIDNDYELRTFADHFINFFGILFVAAALSFIVAIARRYKDHKDVGFAAICSAGVGAVIIFMWPPWVGVFLIAPSTYILFKASA